MSCSRRKFLSLASPTVALWISGCTEKSNRKTTSETKSFTSDKPSSSTSGIKHTANETKTEELDSQRLSDAQSQTDTAEEIYLSWAGPESQSYLGVTVESIPSDFGKLDRLLRKARQNYRQYVNAHPKEGGIRVELNWTRTLHDWVRIQYNTIHGYWELRKARRAVFIQGFTKFNSRADKSDKWRATASEYLSQHKQWWENEKKLHLAEVSDATYDAKVLQLETSLHAMSFAVGSLADYVPVSKTLVDILSQYVNDPAGIEKMRYENLLVDLTQIDTDIQKFCCATEDTGGFINVYQNAISSAMGGLKYLKHASTAKRKENYDERIQYESQAKSAFSRSRLLAHEESKVAEFVEQLSS